MDLDNHIKSIHHYNIMQDSITALKIVCALPSHSPPPPPGTTPAFLKRGIERVSEAEVFLDLHKN